jgi:hypothetical protein
MLAARMPIAGILIAMVVLVGEVVALKAYAAASAPVVAERVVRTNPTSKPHFGRHRGCADMVRISGPDDAVQPAH